jgi:hypothetical protein
MKEITFDDSGSKCVSLRNNIWNVFKL